MDVTEPIVVRLSGILTPDDVPRLCAELSARIRDTGTGDPVGAPTGTAEGAGPVTGTGARGREAVCDVRELTAADLTAIDAIARMRLTTHRLGCRFRLLGPGPELRALLHLVGLSCLTEQPLPPGGDRGYRGS
ncbi:STAS domain-containing protein [Streptomyces sp. NPDC004838]